MIQWLEWEDRWDQLYEVIHRLTSEMHVVIFLMELQYVFGVSCDKLDGVFDVSLCVVLFNPAALCCKIVLKPLKYWLNLLGHRVSRVATLLHIMFLL